jgi:hypothetical protein
MAVKAKAQHWVPQFYLRYFATPDTRETSRPRVWIFSKHGGDPKLTSIRNVAAKSHLYTPKDASGSRDWQTEERLGDLESVVSRMWPELANGFVDLHESDANRKALALFVSTLHLRHPRSARLTVEMHSQLVTFFETIPKDSAGNPLVVEFDRRGKVQPFDASGYAEYRSAGTERLRQVFVDDIRANAMWFAEALLEKRWSVVFSSEPVFITTDTPVTIVHRTQERFGIKTPGTVVSIPLSPTRVLLMDDRVDQPKGQYYPLGSHGPGPFNLEAWLSCERFMISPRSTDQVCAEMMAWAKATGVQNGDPT